MRCEEKDSNDLVRFIEALLLWLIFVVLRKYTVLYTHVWKKSFSLTCKTFTTIKKPR